MKKSILFLLACFLLIIATQSIQAQTKQEPVKSGIQAPVPDVFKAELSAEEKEIVMSILNGSKLTLLRSSNTNTTEQNLQLLRGIEDVMKLLNERFQKVIPEEKNKPKN